MGSSRNCTSGDGTASHTCTLTSQDSLSSGTEYVYMACKDTWDNEFNHTMEMSVMDNGDIILQGIQTSVIWPGASVYKSQPVYVRTLANNQAFGIFDSVAAYGNQRWAFNYVDENETAIGTFYNLSPVFYFLEMQNLTWTEIERQVSLLINNTKR